MSYQRVPTSEGAAAAPPDPAPAAAKTAASPEPEPEEEEEAEERDAVNLVEVGKPTRRVPVRPGMTVLELKRAGFPEAVESGRNVRFIFQGRELADDKTLLEAGVRPAAFVHVAITAARPAGEAGGANAAALAAEGGGEEGDIPEWMLRESAAAEQMQENRAGSGGDFALGFVLGLLVGYFALCWVWSPVVPRRQKAGILLGMSARLALTVWQADRSADAPGAARPTTGPGDDDRVSE